jgi:hypothetical protein
VLMLGVANRVPALELLRECFDVESDGPD